METAKLSKKHKIFLGLSTVVLGAAAVVTPLVSCSKNDESIGAQLDKEFNVTEATYKNLKKQLDAQVSQVIYSQAQEEQREGKWDHDVSLDSIVNSKEQEYKEMITTFDKELYSNSTNKKSFTEISSALSEMAYQKYKIKLNCNGCNAYWSDLEDDFYGALNEAKNYMDNSGIDEGDKKLKLDEAYNQFGNLTTNLKNKYGDGNPLIGIIQGRAEISTLFDGIEEDTTYQAAETKLKDFIGNYDIVLKDFDPNVVSNDDCNPYFEDIATKLEKGDIHLYEAKDPSKTFLDANGNEDSNTIFQDYFTVLTKDGKNITSSFTKNFFAQTAIIGYELQPSIKECHADNITNENVVSVDWQLTKKQPSTKYANRNIFKTANGDDEIVVHLYKPDQEQVEAMEQQDSVRKALNVDGVIEYRQDMSIHKQDEEGLALQIAYFTPKTSNEAASYSADIDFWYDPENKPSLETLVAGEQVADKTYSLNMAQLADSGVYIKDKNDASNTGKEKLSDLIAWKEEETEKVEEEQIPDDELTGPKKFIKYCDILSANCQIIDDTAPEKDIQVSALVTFANTKYKSSQKNSSFKAAWAQSISTIVEDVKMSDQYYEEATEAFNRARHFVYDIYYRQKDFNGTCVVHRIIQSIYIVLTIALMALTWFFWAKIYAPIPTGSPKVIAILACVLVTTSMLLLLASSVLFIAKISSPFEDFSNAVWDFSKKTDPETGEGYFEEIIRLESHGSWYFPIKKDDGSYDNQEKLVKRARFDGETTEKQLEIHDTFVGFSKTPEYLKLMERATKDGVNPDQYKKALKKTFYKNPWFYATVGLVILAIAAIWGASYLLRTYPVEYEPTRTVTETEKRIHQEMLTGTRKRIDIRALSAAV